MVPCHIAWLVGSLEIWIQTLLLLNNGGNDYKPEGSDSETEEFLYSTWPGYICLNFGFCLQSIWIIAGECKTRSASQKSAEFRNESIPVKGRLGTQISKPNYSYWHGGWKISLQFPPSLHMTQQWLLVYKTLRDKMNSVWLLVLALKSVFLLIQELFIFEMEAGLNL